MPVQPPTRQQLEWIADALRVQLTEDELVEVEEVIGPSLEVFRRLDGHFINRKLIESAHEFKLVAPLPNRMGSGVLTFQANQ